MMHPLHERCLTEMQTALRKFGTYAYDDKGCKEVMYIDPLVTEFLKLSAEEAARVLEAMSVDPAFDYRLLMLAGTLIGEMEEWDELFEYPVIEDIGW